MISRRDFVGLAAGAFAAASGAGCSTVSAVAEAVGIGKSPFLFGACRSVKDAAVLKDVGFDFIEYSVPKLLAPDMSDADYAAKLLPDAKKCALPIRSCNGFFPWGMPLVGPDDKLKWKEALAFADVAFRRADDLDIKYIVLGSGKARSAPEGFPKEKAVDQFVEFCKRLADIMEKANRRVVVVLEPLRAAECNIFNFVGQGIDFVDRIGSPHVQLLADIYHMCSGNEKPDVFARADKRLLHCHIATRAHRKAPGLEQDDLTPYLKALAASGYRGGVSIEGGWDGKDFPAAAAGALELLREWSA